MSHHSGLRSAEVIDSRDGKLRTVLVLDAVEFAKHHRWTYSNPDYMMRHLRVSGESSHRASGRTVYQFSLKYRQVLECY